MIAYKRRGILHPDIRQSLPKSPAGIRAGCRQRQKIFIVGDDVRGTAGDGELDELGVFGIAIESEPHVNAFLILSKIQELSDNSFNRPIGDAGETSLKVGISQDDMIFPEYFRAQQNDDTSELTRIHDTPRSRGRIH